MNTININVPVTLNMFYCIFYSSSEFYSPYYYVDLTVILRPLFIVNVNNLVQLMIKRLQLYRLLLYFYCYYCLCFNILASILKYCSL